MESSNIVILCGTVRAAPSRRSLPSGVAVHEFEIITVDERGRSTVPVSSFDASGSIATLEAGANVVVIGTVRRRFFRSGGATVSRTDVVATHVIPQRRRRTVERALAGALGQFHASPQ